MDRVFIKDISLFGKHGVHESERLNEQEFIIDLEVYFDARPAAESDELADTVDYTLFANMVQEIVEQNSFFLIERLAERIAKRLLEDARINEVSVTVKKPAALENGMPGVTVVRGRG